MKAFVNVLIILYVTIGIKCTNNRKHTFVSYPDCQQRLIDYYENHSVDECLQFLDTALQCEDTIAYQYFVYLISKSNSYKRHQQLTHSFLIQLFIADSIIANTIIPDENYEIVIPTSGHFILEAKKINSIFKDNIDSTFQNELGNINIEELSIIEKHQYVQCLNTLATLKFHRDNSFLAWAALDRIISLCSNTTSLKTWNLTLAKAYQSKALYVYSEMLSDSTFKSVYHTCLNRSSSLFNKCNRNTSIQKLYSDFDNLHRVPFESFKNILHHTQNNKANIAQLCIQYAYVEEYIHNNPINSLKFIDFYLDSLNQSFNYLNTIALVYKIEALIKLNKLKDARYIIEHLKRTVKWRDNKSIHYYLSALSDYDQTLKLNISPADVLTNMLTQRKLADSLFHGESEHLQDFYVMNAANVLLAHANTCITDSTQIFHLINLIDNTKKREIKRKRWKIDKHLEIEDFKESLHKVSFFKDTSSYSSNSTSYKDVFTKLLFQDIKTKNTKFYSTEKQPIDTWQLQERLKTNNSQIVEFLKYNENYFAIKITNNQYCVTVFKSDSLEMDILSILNKLPYQKIQTEVLSISDFIISKLNLDTLKNTYLLADGIINYFPMHMVLPNCHVKTIDLRDILDTGNIYVNRRNLGIFNYADVKNNPSTDIPNCSKEVEYFLNTLGNTPLPQMIPNELSLKKAFEKEITHICTHGTSMKDDKYSNYLITGNKNSHTKFYSFQFDNIPIKSKFVFISSCDSGLGYYKAGSGDYSLGSSLLRNGVFTVVHSIWEVNDQAALAFCKEFYTNWLKPNNSILDAIVETRKTMLMKNEYPLKDWIGLTIEGKTNLYLK